MIPPTTPDQRYIVVRGRLWRAANPHLPDEVKGEWVRRLMDARRRVKVAMGEKDAEALAHARRDVHEAKVALGERGPPWWTDGTPDLNRHLARNSPYAAWHASLRALPTDIAS